MLLFEAVSSFVREIEQGVRSENWSWVPAFACIILFTELLKQVLLLKLCSRVTTPLLWVVELLEGDLLSYQRRSKPFLARAWDWKRGAPSPVAAAHAGQIPSRQQAPTRRGKCVQRSNRRAARAAANAKLGRAWFEHGLYMFCALLGVTVFRLLAFHLCFEPVLDSGNVSQDPLLSDVLPIKGMWTRLHTTPAGARVLLIVWPVMKHGLFPLFLQAVWLCCAVCAIVIGWVRELLRLPSQWKEVASGQNRAGLPQSLPEAAAPHGRSKPSSCGQRGKQQPVTGTAVCAGAKSPSTHMKLQGSIPREAAEFVQDPFGAQARGKGRASVCMGLTTVCNNSPQQLGQQSATTPQAVLSKPSHFTSSQPNVSPAELPFAELKAKPIAVRVKPTDVSSDLSSSESPPVTPPNHIIDRAQQSQHRRVPSTVESAISPRLELIGPVPPLQSRIHRWTGRTGVLLNPALLDTASTEGEITNSEADSESECDESLCVICLTNARTMGFLHGATVHACVCTECAPLVQIGDNCPMCRQPVAAVVSIF